MYISLTITVHFSTHTHTHSTHSTSVFSFHSTTSTAASGALFRGSVGPPLATVSSGLSSPILAHASSVTDRTDGKAQFNVVPASPEMILRATGSIILSCAAPSKMAAFAIGGSLSSVKHCLLAYLSFSLLFLRHLRSSHVSKARLRRSHRVYLRKFLWDLWRFLRRTHVVRRYR